MHVYNDKHLTECCNVIYITGAKAWFVNAALDPRIKRDVCISGPKRIWKWVESLKLTAVATNFRVNNLQGEVISDTSVTYFPARTHFDVKQVMDRTSLFPRSSYAIRLSTSSYRPGLNLSLCVISIASKLPLSLLPFIVVCHRSWASLSLEKGQSNLLKEIGGMSFDKFWPIFDMTRC